MDEVEKIVKILRKCDEGGFCEGCDYKGEADSTGVCKVMSDAADMIERLSAELEQVKQERDAAMMELSFCGDCDSCKKNGNECTRRTEQCLGWEWRGVCKENCGGTV